MFPSVLAVLLAGDLKFTTGAFFADSHAPDRRRYQDLPIEERLELTRKFVVASEMIVRQASWENGEGAEDLCRLFEI